MPEMQISGYQMFSITTKKVKGFVRNQNRTKADENVYCIMYFLLYALFTYHKYCVSFTQHGYSWAKANYLPILLLPYFGMLVASE